MKHVIKGTSPDEFEAWKAYKKPTRWGDLPSNRATGPLPEGAVDYSKADLRTILFGEQRGLCCYCNQMLVDDSGDTAIDHVAPKDGIRNQHLIFDYGNLSLSCKGNEKTPKPRELHCDAEKGGTLLALTHFDQACEQEIIYALDGGVSGRTERARGTVATLNLSIDKLNNLRADAIAGFVYEDVERTVLISQEDAQALLERLGVVVASQERLPAFVVAIMQSLQGIS